MMQISQLKAQREIQMASYTDRNTEKDREGEVKKK